MKWINRIDRAGTWCLCAVLMAGLPFATPVLAQYHPADLNGNWVIEKSELETYFKLTPRPEMETELLRAVQFYNAGAYEERSGTIDGFAPSSMTYLVIDLAAQPVAVERLADVPASGWTDAHKRTKLVLRRIPAGQFTMGSPTTELNRQPNETQHLVTVSEDYYIGVFPVTQHQWKLVMNGANPAYFSNTVADYMTRPVERVSYNMARGTASGVDAASFMGRLRALAADAIDLKFDLPTEAQWEYACRAETTTALNSGKDRTTLNGADPNTGEVARYLWNGGQTAAGTVPGASVDTTYGTAEVGSYRVNDWGLFDMHGNVAEWCLDYFGAYPATAVTDPKGAASGNRVLRGGSWGSTSAQVRSAARDSAAANTADYRYGLRVCAPMP